jgi:hypothetical protein
MQTMEEVLEEIKLSDDFLDLARRIYLATCILQEELAAPWRLLKSSNDVLQRLQEILNAAGVSYVVVAETLWRVGKGLVKPEERKKEVNMFMKEEGERAAKFQDWKE